MRFATGATRQVRRRRSAEAAIRARARARSTWPPIALACSAISAERRRIGRPGPARQGVQNREGSLEAVSHVGGRVPSPDQGPLLRIQQSVEIGHQRSDLVGEMLRQPRPRPGVDRQEIRLQHPERGERPVHEQRTGPASAPRTGPPTPERAGAGRSSGWPPDCADPPPRGFAAWFPYPAPRSPAAGRSR